MQAVEQESTQIPAQVTAEANLAEIQSAIEKLSNSEAQQLLTWLLGYLDVHRLNKSNNHNQTDEQSEKESQSEKDLTPTARAFRESLTYDPDAKPIWKMAAEIVAEVPAEEWAKVPTDFAKRFISYQQQDSQVSE